MNRNEFFTRLALAVYKLDGAYDYFAKGGGVKPNLMWLLYALNDGKKHTQVQICDQWLFPRSTVNTLVKQCESEGLVALCKIEGEKREMQVVLTEKGRAFADKILEPVYRAEQQLFDGYLAKNGYSFLEELEKFGEQTEKLFARINKVNLKEGD